MLNLMHTSNTATGREQQHIRAPSVFLRPSTHLCVALSTCTAHLQQDQHTTIMYTTAAVQEGLRSRRRIVKQQRRRGRRQQHTSPQSTGAHEPAGGAVQAGECVLGVLVCACCDLGQGRALRVPGSDAHNQSHGLHDPHVNTNTHKRTRTQVDTAVMLVEQGDAPGAVSILREGIATFQPKFPDTCVAFCCVTCAALIACGSVWRGPLIMLCLCLCVCVSSFVHIALQHAHILLCSLTVQS